MEKQQEHTDWGPTDTQYPVSGLKLTIEKQRKKWNYVL